MQAPRRSAPALGGKVCIALNSSHISDVDLSAALNYCSKEPIHIPGSIQEHGALFVIDTAYIIRHVSENVQVFLDIDPSTIIGKPVKDVLPDFPCTFEVLQHFTPVGIYCLSYFCNPHEILGGRVSIQRICCVRKEGWRSENFPALLPYKY